MVHVSFYRNSWKTFKKPRCPYKNERLDIELTLVGEYGFRCKRELWRKNPQMIFEGKAFLRRMNKYGLLDVSRNKLDYVLSLTMENFLERHLQTLVFKSGMAKSIQHACVLIRKRHIRVRSRSSTGRSVRPSGASQEALCSSASRGMCLF
ncbi:hypothetical protein UlMin_002844 [Ulmus minor]